MRRSVVLLLTLALALGACTGASEETTTTGQSTPHSTTTSTTTPAITSTTSVTPAVITVGLRPVQPFAGFTEIPLLGDQPAYAGPATPDSLDGVLWADQVPDAAADLLAENGFVVVASGLGQFHEAYSHVDLSSRQPLFVTTDAAYHYWHLAFAKALRDTEQSVLLPILEDFAESLSTAAVATAGTYRGTALESQADRVVSYSALLLALLELESGPFTDVVEAELALIRDHAGFADSPTVGAQVDYSLFVPRGHYTQTPELTRFFLAMSSLGNTAFQLGKADQVKTGLVLSGIIAGDPDLTRMWRQLYEPTAFLVGLADDYTPFEAVEAADAASPGWQTAPEALGDDAAVQAVAASMFDQRPVGIDPEMASIRVMGTRFVLDSYILDQLVYPNVGDDENPRLEGSPLDVAAAFGSEWAYQQQVSVGVPAQFPEYDPQLAEMTELVADREIGAWASTVYDGWLYALQPMWSAHGAAYPDFMRGEVWSAKAHNSGFGSYTELKHDTILYAKQAFAEGEGPPPPPAEPRHWVEPEPVVYARLAAVAQLMEDGLADRELLAEDVAEILDRLIDMYGQFERLARDELTGLPISSADNEWLEAIGSRFELLWLLAAGDETGASGGGFPESPNDVAALVADIMSNPTEALELGTGYIDRIYVLVPNDRGEFQVARGGVYSYHEFWVPRDERLTDEEWRQMLAGGEAPDRPPWTHVFLTAEE